MSLPEGIVLVRPDGCYSTLINQSVPSNLEAGVLSAACTGSCVSYMGGRALLKKQPDRVIIGSDEVALAIEAIVNDELSAAPAITAGGLFDGVLLNVLLRLLRDAYRDPSTMDYAADLLARAL
jgi:hypothetical protein